MPPAVRSNEVHLPTDIIGTLRSGAPGLIVPQKLARKLSKQWLGVVYAIASLAIALLAREAFESNWLAALRPDAIIQFGKSAAGVSGANAMLPLILLAMFAGSLVSGLAGFAFSAVAGALLFHCLPPAQAVPLLLICSITTQLFSITKLAGIMQWRGCVIYLIGGITGIPIGATLLAGSESQTFAIGFGLFLICYSAYMLLRPHFTIRASGRLVDVAIGFAGGITGGSTAFPGAIPTIWCNMRGLSKEDQRGIVQPFILVMQVATLLYFSRLGIMNAVTWQLYIWCVPVVVAGTWLGVSLFNRIDENRFRRVVLLFLLICGATLAL